MRKAAVDFEAKRVTVTVEAGRLDEAALVKALEEAGFGGEVLKDRKEAAAKPELPRVAFRVSGMKKTKSGAT